MRFDHQKAFPYPVLRPDIDDYTNSEFQVTVDIDGGKDNRKIDAKVHVALSSEEIRREIDAGNAAISIIFSCRNTYFREAVTTKKLQFTKSFDSGFLRGEVIISPFVVAVNAISKFTARDINAEFNKQAFSFDVGEVLAAYEPLVVYIDRELFRPITSILQLVKSDSLAGFEWRLSFEENKLQIMLSAEAKETIDRARNSRRNKAVLINSIYFAAIMEAVQKLKDDDGTYEDRRWAELIRQQCHNAAINIVSDDPYVITQRLLKTPLALLNQYAFQQEDEK